MTKMSTRDCAHCGKPYQVPAIRGNVTRYCSTLCRRLAGRARDAGRRRDGTRPTVTDLTELNIATTLRYLACKAAGTHRPGRKLTALRPFEGSEQRMPICRTCGVPIPGRGGVFSLTGTRKFGEDVA